MTAEQVTVREGCTDLLVPSGYSSRGPGTRGPSVFYNRQMAFARDVSVMLLRALGPLSAVDCMSAAGSRAVRLANEVQGVHVTANDISAEAYEQIGRNIELNGLKNCDASNMDLACLLAEQRFGYVDLDPFGSPVPFLHAAIKGVERNGVLAVTATDTAPLAGARRDKCERRYMARPLRGPICHEAGLRILMGAVARDLARFDRGMEPLLCFHSDHYFRLHLRVTKGAQRADAMLRRLGWMRYERDSLKRSVSASPEGHPHGPMWLGPLHDRGVLERMEADESLAEPRRCAKALELWSEELDTPICYEVSELSSKLKINPPRMERLLESLRRRGEASRSHVSPTAFRCALPMEDVLDAYREAAGIDNI